ncbi:MAG: peptidoglycan recognition protein family protein [Metamycoplasmataceae bacterium]
MARVQFKKRGFTDHIVIHCSATKPSQDIGVRDIAMWHKQQGWLACGYHYIIRRDGTLEAGRPFDVVGSHVKNHNSNSVAVCLVGGVNDKGQPESNYTDEQWATLNQIVAKLEALYPMATVKGHNEFDAGKACPSFNVKEWLKGRPKGM